jgi:transcriptional regulator GlxA family with amidase domain
MVAYLLSVGAPFNSRMLIETNHLISEIALAMGFPGVEHIARYFREERHMTPLSYRKIYGQK